MITIGITGGIGSGKSVVSKILESLNFPVFNSDEVAKQILIKDTDAQKELIAEFGPDVYHADGSLNKKLLGEIIFSDEKARSKVNSFVHPRVRKSFEQFSDRSESKLVFNEAAILFETGAYLQFNKTILVSAPEALRIERVMKRDNVSSNAVKSRMAAQWSDAKKIELADYVIVNDGKSSVLEQLEEILRSLTQLL